MPRGPRGHTLIMVDDAGCIYCARWRAEVGPTYARSAEGRFAPLAVVRRGDPVASALRDIRYTPTFVLVDGEREAGRIVGYPGADFFWSQLESVLFKEGFRREQPPVAPAGERETRLPLRHGMVDGHGAPMASALG